MTTKTPKMESVSHKVPTYFVYEARDEGKELGEIIGPIFPEEIEDIKNDVFTNKQVQIDPESIFKMFHYEQYRRTFKDYWYDFVARLIDSLDVPIEYHIDTTIELDETEEFYEEAAARAEDWNGEFDNEDVFDLDELEDDSIPQAEDYSIISQFFTINKDIEGHERLFISFSIDFSPYWVGVLTKELALYLDGIYELEIGEPFYIARNGDVVTGIDECYFERMRDTTRYHSN